MKVYFYIYKFWSIRSKNNHLVHVKKIYKFPFRLVCLPVIILVLTMVLFALGFKFNQASYTLLPTLNIIFIVFLFNMKNDLLKYDHNFGNSLIETGKDEIPGYSILNEYVSFIEYSLFLMVLAIIVLILQSLNLSGAISSLLHIKKELCSFIVLSFTLMLFIYSFVFSCISMDMVINRVRKITDQ